MDIISMHYDFDLKFDKVNSQHRQNFNRAEKDWLLNEARDVVLKQRYGLTNNYKTGFEGIQKRIDDLSSIHIKYPVQPYVALTYHEDENIYELPLSSLLYDYWLFTRGVVKVVDDSCNATYEASIAITQNDDLNYRKNDPFNDSNHEEVLANFGSSSTGSSIYFYPGNLTLSDAYIEYLRKPARMNYGGYVYIDGVTYPQTDCDLPEILHTEIVDMAVNIAAGIIENPNYARTTAEKLFRQE